jgi:transcriptional/translational regulatory protein YebC/TACO1
VEAIRKAGHSDGLGEIAMVPKNLMKLEGKNAQRHAETDDALEEHDDVQNVYSNFDIDESELESMS